MNQVDAALTPIVVQILQGILIALGGLALTAITYAGWYLKKRMGVRDAGDSLEKNIATAAASAQQTKVDPMKAAGTFTDQAAAEVKAEVIATAKQMTGPIALAVLEKDKGAEAVAATLDHSVEAAVRDAKAMPPSAAKLADLTVGEAEAVVAKDVKK